MCHQDTRRGEGRSTVTSFQATHKCHNTSKVGSTFVVFYHCSLLVFLIVHVRICFNFLRITLLKPESSLDGVF